MWRTVMPSTPAERAPRFPLTRLHATSRKAGSQTRLYRSPNRRPSSSPAHRCSLICITSTRASASSASGTGAAVLTAGLLAPQQGCTLAVRLRHVDGFPALGLLRGLRPLGSYRPTTCLPLTCLASRPEGGSRGFPRSPLNRSAEEVPSSAPATSPRVRRRPSPWPPCRREHPARESLALSASVHRSPAHIRQVGAGGGFVELYSAGSSRTPFRLV